MFTSDLPRAVLEARYLERASDYIEAAGVRLHVRDRGPRDAPAVLLLHGFASSLHTWDAWVPALSADHRVVVLDLPSAGLTGADPTGVYTDARSVEVLLALLDNLGIARASVVGHSIGGRIAFTLAATHPRRVERLVLIAPDGFASSFFRYGKAPRIPFLFRLARYLLPRSLVQMSLMQAYGDRARLTQERVTRYHELLQAPGVREASFARLEQTVLTPPEPMLRKIDAPTLLMWGARDAIIPVANARDYERELPNCRVTIFEGLGHVPQEEAPEVTLEAVEAFLAG